MSQLDAETLLIANNVLTTQIENAKSEIATLNDKYDDSLLQIEVWRKKLDACAQDNAQKTKIMTDTIIDSNAKIQAYLGEIQEHRGIIQQLKAQIDKH